MGIYLSNAYYRELPKPNGIVKICARCGLNARQLTPNHVPPQEYQAQTDVHENNAEGK